MSKELLLEIGTEEIPSVYLKNILNNMKIQAEEMFEKNYIDFKNISFYATPRRLVIFVEEVNEIQKTIEQKIFGPPKNKAYDKNGNLTNAALGFANGKGIEIKDLKVEMTKKGEYLYALKHIGGEEVSEKLSLLLTNYIKDLYFPKTMKWGKEKIKFVRPIHWILCLFGNSIINFNINKVNSSNMSRGHRFLSPKPFPVDNPCDYFEKLRDNYVIFDQEERKNSIISQISSLADKVEGTIVEDNTLLDEITFLVEYPVAVMGNINKEYLSLPKELLITAMREHQRFFSLENKEKNILPYFITIANIKSPEEEIIKKGNERVLAARLADAYFFLKEDQKIPFDQFSGRLNSILFQEQLGTVAEKVERIVSLSTFLAEKIDNTSIEKIKKAASLCKTDLVTHTVYEFPSLQGIMGSVYAKKSGETDETSLAILEHYLPRFSEDKLPGSTAGMIIAIADRIDTITGCFGIGMLPTGSQDPHALRRQALGIINIIVEKKLDINIPDLINKSIFFLKDKITKDPSQIKEDIIAFLKLRYKNQIEAKGISYDIVDAVISNDFSNLIFVNKKIYALLKFRTHPDFVSIATAFKRVVNILSKNAVNNKSNPGLFNTSQEKELYNTLNSIKEEVLTLIEKGDYLKSLHKIVKIQIPVDNFFNNVLVMEKDPVIKENRLCLLTEISEIFLKIADFSKLIVE